MAASILKKFTRIVFAKNWEDGKMITKDPFVNVCDLMVKL